MCGIIGGCRRGGILKVLLSGLQRMEYRGYDSAGVAVLDSDGGIYHRRAVGRVATLRRRVAADASVVTGSFGIGHTRWATHGGVTEANAHPIVVGGVAVAHNGIIENYGEIKAELIAAGRAFSSDTDTEVIAHLLAAAYEESGDLLAALRRTLGRLRGAFAFAAMAGGGAAAQLVCARQGNPLLLGRGKDGVFVASDAQALAGEIDAARYLEDGEYAAIDLAAADGAAVWRADGTAAAAGWSPIRLRADETQLGAYRHFMQKEIFEQPDAVAATMKKFVAKGALNLRDFGAGAARVFRRARSVTIVACGTSYHAGLIARGWFARFGIDCRVVIASEYRAAAGGGGITNCELQAPPSAAELQAPPSAALSTNDELRMTNNWNAPDNARALGGEGSTGAARGDDSTQQATDQEPSKSPPAHEAFMQGSTRPAASSPPLTLCVSQSGETADTLAAARYARACGLAVWSVVNVEGSTLARESDGVFLTRAGVEVGVASTKAFTAQMVALLLLSMAVAKAQRRLAAADEAEALGQLRYLPYLLGKAMLAEGEVAEWARELARYRSALFIGRGAHYPLAMEGALKLKEISYIHAEGLAAGELKHGSLALVDDAMPVVALAADGALCGKMAANIAEVVARGGRVFVLAGRAFGSAAGGGGDEQVRVIRLDDDGGEWLSPIVWAAPLQLLAYHTAKQKGTDIDKPRNLAKSVTVE